MIYKNNPNRKVHLDVPIEPLAGTLEAEVFNENEVVHQPLNFYIDDEGHYFNMPFELVQNDKDYEVQWRFSYEEEGQFYEYVNSEIISVVTPILSFSEIKKILEQDSDIEEAEKVEKAVRHIVQSHTGQFFGRYVGKKYITGNGESHLRLPMKLISMASINGNARWHQGLIIRGSGWFLQSRSFAAPTIRADLDGWHESAWGYSNQAPIVAPYTKAVTSFMKNVEYEIDGVWGWDRVPEAVQEAAKLLINDYACADSQYRDRFLTSMTAADWRIQFHEGAFSNTGNVRANQLLSEFVLRRGWAVI